MLLIDGDVPVFRKGRGVEESKLNKINLKANETRKHKY